VGLHAIHHDPPLSSCVDGTKGHKIACHAGAEVSLLWELHQPIHAVLSVSQHILVQGGYTGIVILDGVGDFIGWIFCVFKAPGFGCVLATSWGAVMVWFGVVGWCGMMWLR